MDMTKYNEYAVLRWRSIVLFTMHDVNIIIEIWCASFSVVGLLCVALFSRAAQRSAHWYRRSVSLMFVFNMVTALADATAGVFRGNLSPIGWYGTHIGNALNFACVFLLAGAFTSYLCARLDGDGKLGAWGSLTWAICGVGIALSMSGLFYTIDPMTNLYNRTDFYWIAIAMGVFIEVGNLVVLLVYRKTVGWSTFFAMMMCTLLPIVALVMQIYVYGLNVSLMANTVSSMILFVDLQAFLAQSMVNQQENLARRERELSDSRIQIMVSQIQPHFLYNTLDAIYYLCGKDPKQARSAISKFSDYLRMNLQSLRAKAPIPFNTELEHVKNYLDLERMSSDDTIDFDLDIQASDFMLPALSIQPLVENSIKHGVTKRPEGGHIKLSTRELADCYTVIVEDDGVGFDMNAEPDQSRPHVGMQNVRQRVESMCGGTLDVTSEPGVGTTAIVRIPKKELPA